MFEYDLVKVEPFVSSVAPISVRDVAEKAIKDHAADGWRVVSLVPSEYHGYLILFERELPVPSANKYDDLGNKIIPPPPPTPETEKMIYSGRKKAK